MIFQPTPTIFLANISISQIWRLVKNLLTTFREKCQFLLRIRFIGYSALISKLAESTKKFTQSTSYYLQSNEELDPELAGRLIAMIGAPSQRHKKRIKSDQSVKAIIGLDRISQTISSKQVMSPKQEESYNKLTQRSFAVNSLSLLPIEETFNSGSKVSIKSTNENLGDIWNPFSVQSKASSEETPDTETTQKTCDTEAPSDSWKIENFNAGGFCLHYKADGMCTTRVGEIIAIRDENKSRETSPWRIGIIRWMQGLPNKEHKIGVELFGAECVSISAYNKNNSNVEHNGLLLKRIHENNKNYSLLLPINTNLDSREIIIKGSK